MINCLNFPSEPVSDQSDIESRIKALKEELRKRKFMASQLKKEQKKRNKERLKAQEASLLKQLEVKMLFGIYLHCVKKKVWGNFVPNNLLCLHQSYDDFIEKTKAELKKEPEAGTDSKTSILTGEHSGIETPAQMYEGPL